MIKFFALIFMIIDHLGAVFFNDMVLMRLIGRFSMPLFAYCVARSYYHYVYFKKSGSIKKYLKNLLIFSLVSQVPFQLFCWKFLSFNLLNFSKKMLKYIKFNIGFTWLLSIILICALEKIDFSFSFLKFKNNFKQICIIVLVIIFSIFVEIDYGLYGVLFPVVFFYFSFKFYSPILLFIFNFLNYCIFCLTSGVKLFNLMQTYQSITIFVVFIVFSLNKYDGKMRLPKFIFYWFYPLHLLIITLTKQFLV